MSDTVRIEMPKKLEAVRAGVVANRARHAASAISGAFVWDATEEGHDFWSSVQARLNQLADRGY